MARLVEQGKVRFLGLCEARRSDPPRPYDPSDRRGAERIFAALPEEATETRELTRDLGIIVCRLRAARSRLLDRRVPDLRHLDEGDTRGRHPRFMGENFAKNRALVAKIEAIAEEKELHPGAAGVGVAVGAGAGRDPDPGHQAHRRLEENLGAVDVRADRRRRRPDLGRDPDRGHRRHPLPRGRHARRLYLTAIAAVPSQGGFAVRLSPPRSVSRLLESPPTFAQGIAGSGEVAPTVQRRPRAIVYFRPMAEDPPCQPPLIVQAAGLIAAHQPSGSDTIRPSELAIGIT